MQDEVRVSVGEHDVNVEMDAVYRPRIDTPFPPSLFQNIPFAGSGDYPKETDYEQNKENE